MMKKWKNQNGFSLIEGVLATMLLSFSLSGGVFMMQNTMKNSISSDYRIIATQLANEKIETILADKALDLGYNGITSDAYQSESLSYGNNNSAFARSVSVTEVAENDLTTPEEGSGMKKVEVTVSWGQESNEQITVSTLLTNY